MVEIRQLGQQCLLEVWWEWWMRCGVELGKDIGENWEFFGVWIHENNQVLEQ